MRISIITHRNKESCLKRTKMDASIQTAIITRMQQCVGEIQADMQALSINASGRTAASMHVRNVDDGGFQIVVGREGDHKIDAPFDLQQRDTAPADTLEIGRPGGNVPRGFYYIIKQWSKEKGLAFPNESERATFAYFTAKKIAAEGTHRNQAHEDVYSTHVSVCADDIKATLTSALRNTIRYAIGAGAVSTSGLHF